MSDVGCALAVGCGTLERGAFPSDSRYPTSDIALPFASMPEPIDTPPAPQPFFRRLGPAGILAIFAAVLPPLGGLVLAIYASPVAAWLRAHNESGPFIYAAAFAVLAGFALLPTYIQSGLGGFAFGVTIGVPAALAGFAGASLIGYEVARRASGDRVVKIINEKPKWRAVRDALVGVDAKGQGFWRTLGIVTLVRLPPNSPFALTNLVMASVKVPRAAFLIGTILGMAPRTAAAVYVGATLKEFTKGELEKATVWPVTVGGIAITILVVIVIGRLATRAIHRMAKRDQES
jgi:uncharacterized membrane protein YdjX (TVP38/TMEM64 family)